MPTPENKTGPVSVSYTWLRDVGIGEKLPKDANVMVGEASTEQGRSIGNKGIFRIVVTRQPEIPAP